MYAKKEIRNGVVHLTSVKFTPFFNAETAIIAMQALQNYLAVKGYLVNSRINLEQKIIELTAYFDGANVPTLPSGYRYTWKDISIHSYYSEVNGREVWIRKIDYHFEF